MRLLSIGEFEEIDKAEEREQRMLKDQVSEKEAKGQGCQEYITENNEIL